MGTKTGMHSNAEQREPRPFAGRRSPASGEVAATLAADADQLRLMAVDHHRLDGPGDGAAVLACSTCCCGAAASGSESALFTELPPAPAWSTAAASATPLLGTLVMVGIAALISVPLRHPGRGLPGRIRPGQQDGRRRPLLRQGADRSAVDPGRRVRLRRRRADDRRLLRRRPAASPWPCSCCPPCC